MAAPLRPTRDPGAVGSGRGWLLWESWGVSDWVVDLDGVMWRGGQDIPGSPSAVSELLDRGEHVVFCTNNSTVPGHRRETELRSAGVTPGFGVITSADAAATLVERDQRVLLLGSAQLGDQLRAAGAVVTPVTELADQLGASGGWDDPTEVLGATSGFAAVVLGLARGVRYEHLDLVCSAIHQGARFLATNTDATFPASGRLQPGTGAIVAAVEAATSTPPTVAGKPNAPMAEAIRRAMVGDARASAGVGAPGFTPEHGTAGASAGGGLCGVVVGDRVDTDGRLAHELGFEFALVLSGVTGEVPSAADVPVHAVATDLASLVAGDLLGGSLRALGPGTPGAPGAV